jgi:NAD(P)-dependent dehydrogenase (short-subunit alcohol dehydrogenase family)
MATTATALPLSSQVVAIMGSSSGLGFAAAKAALNAGARVFVSATSESKLSATLTRLNGGDAVRGCTADVMDDQSVSRWFAAVSSSYGHIDHFAYTVGDAPILIPGLDIDEQKAQRCYDTRYWGLLRCIRYAHPCLRKSFKSSITATSGTPSQQVPPTPGFMIAASAIAAVESSIRYLALDLAPIRVNCVSPGIVDTEFWHHYQMPADVQAAYFNKAASAMPSQHIAVADEIAEAYLFLCRCHFITGQTIVLDGGKGLKLA